MSTSYNRDAFSDLMEQLRMQGTPMGETNVRGKSSIGTVATPSGGGSSGGSSGGTNDFFTNLIEGVQTNAALNAAAQTPGSSYPGFSVGDIDSTAYMPATGMAGTTGQTGVTTGFSSDVFGTSQFQQPVNFAGASNALDTVYMSDVFGLDSPLVTDLSGGVGPFYGPDKLYPGDVGAGYDPDAYFASKGYTKNPNTGKIIDTSKYNVTGGEPTSSTAGLAAAPTGTDQVTVTGQRGTGISGVLPSAGVTAIDVTGKRTDDETVVGGGPTVSTLPAGDDITAIDVIGQRTDDKEEETTFFNTALNTISTVSGVPLDKVYEVVTTAEKPKDLVLNALDSLGITIPEIDFGTAGETFEVRPENLVPPYFDPTVTDGSGMNDNTTAAGTGGGDGFSIPQRTGIRSVVPGTYDPNRRAGSGGQRYFSDMQYVPNVADPAAQRTANLAAQAQTNTQAMQLALANARNPARQTKPGKEAIPLEDRIASLLGQSPVTNVGAGQTTGTTATIPATTTPAATIPATTTPAAITPAATIPATTTPAAITYERLPEQTDLSYDFMSGLNAALAVEDPAVTEFKETLLNPEESTAIQAATTGPQQRTPTEILEGIAADTDDRISTQEQNAVASLLKSGQTDIDTINKILGVETYDVLEGLLRGGYQTPAETVAMLQGYGNEGFTEEQLIANLLEEGRATPEEISSYYGIPVEAITQRYTELGGTRQFAQGGDINGYYLGGATDGMADQIPATINNMQPAALSDGEFVIPADVVSHLGNGNSDSGAKNLHSMMDRVRKDRTGTTKQGRQIDPNKYLA
tara:strand:- start:324 stop:2732 length:2409 start_codon:yes stop_codon:yes gene_type:complete